MTFGAVHYHAVLGRLGHRPARTLEHDLLLTDQSMSYAGTPASSTTTHNKQSSALVAARVPSPSIAIANNGHYSDCRVWAPRTQRWERDLCRLIERDVDDVVHVDVPLRSLVAFHNGSKQAKDKYARLRDALARRDWKAASAELQRLTEELPETGNHLILLALEDESAGRTINDKKPSKLFEAINRIGVTRRFADLGYDADHNFKLNSWSYAWPRFTKPFYFGKAAHGMVFLLMFDKLYTEEDEIRFSLFKIALSNCVVLVQVLCSNIVFVGKTIGVRGFQIGIQ